MARFYPSGGAGGGGIDPDELTATPAQILEGYVGGAKGYDDPVGGTMKNRNIVDPVTGGINSGYPTIAVHKSDNVQINTTVTSKENLLNIGVPSGHYNGSYVGATMPKVAAVLGISSGIIRAGYTVAGVPGDAWVQWTGDTNATPADMSEGKTAYVNGAKLSGTIPWRGTAYHGVGCGINDAGLYYHIPKGRYEEGAGNPWVYMTRAEIGNLVTSVVSFSVAQYANLTMVATWANPSRGPWSGLRIMAKQGSYPVNEWDGTCLYHGSGTSCTFTLAAGVWYFRAWNYINTTYNGEWWVGPYVQTATTNNVIRGQQKFTASGTFTVPANVRSIDMFTVGGGGGGAGPRNYAGRDAHGGGGGRTSTVKNVSVTPGQQIQVTIGSGGIGGNINYSRDPSTQGGTTSIGSVCSSSGGTGTRHYIGTDDRGNPLYRDRGGDGGSGGGASGYVRASDYVDEARNAGSGGSDGSDGSQVYVFDMNSGSFTPHWITSAYTGIGQHSTTREFGESGATLYGGGGGGGSSYDYGSESGSADAAPGAGGAGGGGAGRDAWGPPGEDGAVNTGGGGGSGTGGRLNGGQSFGGNGGSGIAIIRWGY